MCSLCRQFPCHPRCPNAPEPVPLMRCKECGEGIYEGDEYYDTGNGGICKECIEVSFSSFLRNSLFLPSASLLSRRSRWKRSVTV